MRIKQILPNSLSVVSDLYLDHLIFVAVIATALFAGGFLLHP